MTEKKRISYFKLWWPENIGNAFIDMGSILSIKRATGYNGVIYPISAFPIQSFAYGPKRLKYKMLENIPRSAISHSRKLLGKRFNDIKDPVVSWAIGGVNKRTIKNALDLVNGVKADYIVLSGMLMTVGFFDVFEEVFWKLKKRNVKIIFNGVGGSKYSDTEIEEVRKRLVNLEPYAFISRDDIAFKNYRDLSQHSLDGIDCAFFVNDLPMVQQIESDLPEYVVFSFDKYEYLDRCLEQKYQTYMIIRTSHFFDKIPKSHFYKPNMLISDSPYDYLILYSHAREVHADRVHSCVPTLSFGKPCRLYRETARAELFKKVGADDINKKVVYPDIKKIEREKERQVKFLSTVIT